MGNSFKEFITRFPVMEHFYTVQGEGANAGKAAYFIRLAGCDVGCPWCDVKESWEQEGFPVLEVEEMVTLVEESGAQNVVITGGEPCMFDLTQLSNRFRSKGFNLWLETSGAYAITGEWDWVVVSPKRRKAVLEDSLSKANELKVVAVRRPDLDWAEEFLSSVRSDAKAYLQPEWSREDEILPAIINYVKKNPRWQISLQTHKYMRIP